MIAKHYVLRCTGNLSLPTLCHLILALTDEEAIEQAIPMVKALALGGWWSMYLFRIKPLSLETEDEIKTWSPKVEKVVTL